MKFAFETFLPGFLQPRCQHECFRAQAEDLTSSICFLLWLSSFLVLTLQELGIETLRYCSRAGLATAWHSWMLSLSAWVLCLGRWWPDYLHWVLLPTGRAEWNSEPWLQLLWAFGESTNVWKNLISNLSLPPPSPPLFLLLCVFLSVILSFKHMGNSNHFYKDWCILRQVLWVPITLF